MKKITYIALAAALTGFSMLTGCQKDEGDSLKVGTFNISVTEVHDVNEQRKIASDAGVEVFGIQEVDRNTRRHKEKMKYDPMPEFEKEPYIDSHYQAALPFGGGEYGLGIVSSYKASKKDGGLILNDGNLENLKATEELKKIYAAYDGRDPESVARLEAVWEENSLIDQGALEPRAYARIVFEKNGKSIAFYSVHLSTESMEVRAQQIKYLNELLKKDPTEYKIMVGDFNTDQNTKELDAFTEDFTLVNGYQGVWRDTYRIEYPTMNVDCIDNIIVSKNIGIKEIEVVDTKGLSDHDMLTAELILK